MGHVFQDIDDEIIGDLCGSWRQMFDRLHEVMDALQVDRYADMGDANVEIEQLRAHERGLAAELAHEIDAPRALDEKTRRSSAAEPFLHAAQLMPLFRHTVGHAEEFLSSVPLHTLPHFRTEPGGELNTKHPEAVSLHRRREFLQILRRELVEQDAFINAEARKEIFDLYFPDNPLLAAEVQVIVTMTCVYWCLPQKDELLDRADEQEFAAAEEWLRCTGRFSFQYFSHFPTFSSYEARESDEKWLVALEEKSGFSRAEVIRLLNSSVTLEKTTDLEKYLVHDTWGHMWQGDMTRLGVFYDTMESLQSPVDANDHLRLVSGRIVSPVDLLYPVVREGKLEIQIDEEGAEEYFDEWIRLRMNAAVAPLMAEMTADAIEYKYQLEKVADAPDLPSSSWFADLPSKLDFAWVDLSYFLRSLRNNYHAYTKDEALRRNMEERTAILLRRKYRKAFRRADDPSADGIDPFPAEVHAAIERMMELGAARVDLHLSQDWAERSTAAEAAEPNSFDLLFTNFLRIQATLNKIILESLQHKKPNDRDGIVFLLLAMILHYQKDPERHFWQLDEWLASESLTWVDWYERGCPDA